jgi:chromate transporter
VPLRTKRRRITLVTAVAVVSILCAWDLALGGAYPAAVFLTLSLIAAFAFLRSLPRTTDPRPSVAGLLREALILGAVSFGGGLAALSLIEQRLVRERRWVHGRLFLEASALGQSLPGAVGTNALCFIGLRLVGPAGAIAAVVGFVTPSLLLMLLFGLIYPYLRGITAVEGLFRGLNPAVAGLVGAMAVRLAGQAVLGRDGRPGGWRLLVRDRWSLIVMVGATVGATVFHLGVVELVLLAGMIGVLRSLSPALGRELAQAGQRWNWLRWRTRRVARAAAAAGGVWWRRLRGGTEKDLLALAPLLPLALPPVATNLGTKLQSLGELSGVFLRAGALTFGGGLVMIPLLEAELVHARQWLSPQAFTDAMALGQVTPGPVVITATFVGYRIVGLTGALLATAAVFLPAFLMVLTLGTSVERFRSNPSVQAFLDGIQPAIVGLMFAAAALLVRHGVVDPVGGVLAVVSFVLIARWQVAPAWVLLGSCAVGVAATLLGV